MRSQCISRPSRTPSLPTTGTLFSAWQATTQALQPVQTSRSIVIAHCATRRRRHRRLVERGDRAAWSAVKPGSRRYAASVRREDQRPVLHARMRLRARQRMRAADAAQRGADGEERRRRAPQRRDVDAEAGADAGAAPPPPAEPQRHRVVGVAGHDERRDAQRRGRRRRPRRRPPRATPSRAAVRGLQHRGVAPR